MTGNTDQFDKLPPVEAVREWARGLVAARGDAHVNWLHVDGLRIEHLSVTFGKPIMLARENVGAPTEGGTNIVRRIELATYPDADFAAPFWHQPERRELDVPSQMKYRRYARYNEICMPHPLVMPTLARVVMWQDWVPELRKASVEVVGYTLYELRPEFQRQIAYVDIDRPSIAEWLRGSEK